MSHSAQDPDARDILASCNTQLQSESGFRAFAEPNSVYPTSLTVCFNEQNVQIGLKGRQEVVQFRRLIDGIDASNDLGMVLRTGIEGGSDQPDMRVLVVGRVRIMLPEEDWSELCACVGEALTVPPDVFDVER
jgi:hypothetical protein